MQGSQENRTVRDVIRRPPVVVYEDSTLRDAGHTIVIITHNMKTIAEHCDRVIAMAEGKILLEGTPRALFAQPERLLEAEIKPSQITQLGQRLNDIGFPPDVLTVDEMVGIVLHNLGRNGG